MSKLREKYGIRNAYDRYAKRAHPAPANDTSGQLNLF